MNEHKFENTLNDDSIVDNIYSLIHDNKEDVVENVELYLIYGQYYYTQYHNTQEEYNKSEYYFNKALELDSNNCYALNGLGIIHLELNSVKTLDLLNKAVMFGSNNALINLGNYYMRKKKYEEAKKNYLEAYNKGIKSSIVNLGNYYMDINNIDEAIKCYLEGIDNNISESYANLGYLYMINGDNENAKKYLVKGMELEIPECYLNMASYYRDVENNLNLSVFIIQNALLLLPNKKKLDIIYQ